MIFRLHQRHKTSSTPPPSQTLPPHPPHPSQQLNRFRRDFAVVGMLRVIHNTRKHFYFINIKVRGGGWWVRCDWYGEEGRSLLWWIDWFRRSARFSSMRVVKPKTPDTAKTHKKEEEWRPLCHVPLFFLPGGSGVVSTNLYLIFCYLYYPGGWISNIFLSLSFSLPTYVLRITNVFIYSLWCGERGCKKRDVWKYNYHTSPPLNLYGTSKGTFVFYHFSTPHFSNPSSRKIFVLHFIVLVSNTKKCRNSKLRTWKTSNTRSRGWGRCVVSRHICRTWWRLFEIVRMSITFHKTISHDKWGSINNSNLKNRFRKCFFYLWGGGGAIWMRVSQSTKETFKIRISKIVNFETQRIYLVVAN